MAMKPCRECKTKISSRAKRCPNCGIDKPFDIAIHRGLNRVASWCFKVGITLTVILILVVMFGCGAAWAEFSGDHDTQERFETLETLARGGSIGAGEAEAEHDHIGADQEILECPAGTRSGDPAPRRYLDRLLYLGTRNERGADF